MATKFIGVRLPPALAAAAKDEAKRDNRSLSNYILDLIARDLEKRGLHVHEESAKYRTDRSKTSA